MLAYALPTPQINGNIGSDAPQINRVLWVPGSNRFCWGELKGLGSRITVLSPDPDLDVSELPLKFHDNLYRPTVRRVFSRRFFSSWVGRAMLWGCIWLVGRTAGESALEGIVSGLYLLVGLPLFFRLSADIQKRHAAAVLARFNELFYSPNVEVVYSPRLEKLSCVIVEEGIISALEQLDEMGLGHLREFYKRAAWSGRWEVGPPTGMGQL